MTLIMPSCRDVKRCEETKNKRYDPKGNNEDIFDYKGTDRGRGGDRWQKGDSTTS